MIYAKQISHIYTNKTKEYKALSDVSFEIPNNKFVVLFGQSGSGKTTLLNILAGLLRPTVGEIVIDNKSIYAMTSNELSQFRKENIGFVFQDFFLEDCYTAKENIYIPLLLNKGLNKTQLNERVEELLSAVDLKEKGDNKPTELSGGECQRVAIARALANNPKIIIADEPTGNLDSQNGLKVIELLSEQVKLGRTVIMVTHNDEYKKYADIVIHLVDGKIE